MRCFQPGEGPSRGLLRDCKTSRNLRVGSFEALISIELGQSVCSVDISKYKVYVCVCARYM